RAARASGDPDVVALHLDPGVSPDAIVERGFPLERTAAYVCVGTACSAPLADEGSLRRELESARDRVACIPYICAPRPHTAVGGNQISLARVGSPPRNTKSAHMPGAIRPAFGDPMTSAARL